MVKHFPHGFTGNGKAFLFEKEQCIIAEYYQSIKSCFRFDESSFFCWLSAPRGTDFK
jgi:hypothetical protein